MALAGALLLSALAGGSTASAQAPLSIRVVGNHFVNGDGQTIRLLGVDRDTSEYECFEYGYNDGHFDDADAAAIASWNANAVRVPMNQDCWLGINGLPTTKEAGGPELTAAGYQASIESYVAALNAHGIYAILELHLTGAGSVPSTNQHAMPDEHSIEFWSQVASAFKGNQAVVFDLLNEPYDQEEIQEGGLQVSWDCWRDGGCPILDSGEGEEPSKGKHPAVGMQTLVDTVRATGSTAPIMLGGLDYANDLTQELSHLPSDPLGQLAASFHNYQDKRCNNVGCWNAELAPIAAQIPLVAGEFAQETCKPSNFDEEFMNWSDSVGVSYLSWAWYVLEDPYKEQQEAECQAYLLVSDYSGTPESPNGVAVRNHLLSLPRGGVTPTLGPAPIAPVTPIAVPTPTKGPIHLLGFSGRVKPGDAKVAFQVSSATACTGTLAGQSTRKYATPSGKKRRVSLGSVGFSLPAGDPQTVVLKLSAAARKVLADKGSLPSRFTLTLAAAGSATTVLDRPLTLKHASGHHG